MKEKNKMTSPVFETRRAAAEFANQHDFVVVDSEDGKYMCVALPQEPEIETEAFNNACAMFRSVCENIGILIGVTDFRGGFGDMETFRDSPQFHTLEGLQLAMEWCASNEQCKYEGAKIGLGQPDWWNRCWQKLA